MRRRRRSARRAAPRRAGEAVESRNASDAGAHVRNLAGEGPPGGEARPGQGRAGSTTEVRPAPCAASRRRLRRRRSRATRSRRACSWSRSSGHGPGSACGRDRWRPAPAGSGSGTFCEAVFDGDAGHGCSGGSTLRSGSARRTPGTCCGAGRRTEPLRVDDGLQVESAVSNRALIITKSNAGPGPPRRRALASARLDHRVAVLAAAQQALAQFSQLGGRMKISTACGKIFLICSAPCQSISSTRPGRRRCATRSPRARCRTGCRAPRPLEEVAGGDLGAELGSPTKWYLRPSCSAPGAARAWCARSTPRGANRLEQRLHEAGLAAPLGARRRRTVSCRDSQRFHSSSAPALRSCSIATFISTEMLVSSLEASVLALAQQLLDEEVEPFADPPPAFEQPLDLVEVGAQAGELLGHVDAGWRRPRPVDRVVPAALRAGTLAEASTTASASRQRSRKRCCWRCTTAAPVGWPASPARAGAARVPSGWRRGAGSSRARASRRPHDAKCLVAPERGLVELGAASCCCGTNCRISLDRQVRVIFGNQPCTVFLQAREAVQLFGLGCGCGTGGPADLCIQSQFDLAAAERAANQITQGVLRARNSSGRCSTRSEGSGCSSLRSSMVTEPAAVGARCVPVSAPSVAWGRGAALALA